MTTKQATRTLASKNIKTLSDLDEFRHAHPCKDGSIESRFGVLRDLVGFDHAAAAMNELALLRVS